MGEPSRVSAIEKETGISWSDWSAHLDGVGGADLTHKQIAMRAEEHMPASVNNAAWWAQAVAVAYTQYLGRRVPGQRQDGSFYVTVPRTLEGNLNQVFAKWLNHVEDRDSFGGSTLSGETTTRATNQWRRWRARLEDGSRIEIEVGLRSGKTVLAVTHSKLHSSHEVEERRAWWKEFLAQL